MNDLFLKGLRVEWEQVEPRSYLRRIPALRGLNELRFTTPVTCLVGENGAGKSTLLEAIAVACGFNPEGGTIHYRFSNYDDVSELGQALVLSRGISRPQTSYFFRAESFFNMATKAEEYDKMLGIPSYGDRGLHQQSHGESFLSFFSTFQGPGLYLMDEPEAALSPQRQLTLLVQMAEMARQGAQFVLATHSPILLGLPGARILSFAEDGLHECRYEDTESVQVTKLFLQNREQLLRHLLSE